MITSRASTKEQDGTYACSWEKLKGKTPACLQMECRWCSASASEQIKIGSQKPEPSTWPRRRLECVGQEVVRDQQNLEAPQRSSHRQWKPVDGDVVL